MDYFAKRIQIENQTLTETKMMVKLLKDRAITRTGIPTVSLIKTENQTLIKNQAINLLTQTKSVAVAEEKAGVNAKILPL